MEGQKTAENKKFFILGLVSGLVVVAVLGGVYMLGARYGNGGGTQIVQGNNDNNPNNAQPSAQQPEGDFSKIAKVSKDDHVRGDSKAKITMIEYSDFECPFCARFKATTDQVLEQYKGKVKLVYRHFPLRSIHPNAQKAAEASECAAEQGKFWEMHDKLFALNEAGTLSVETMKNAAKELALDTNKFNDCLDTSKMANEVNKDYQDGIAGGISGTPGTFINDQYVAGALPFEDIKTIIESQL